MARSDLSVRRPLGGMRLSDFDDWARAHHGIITLEASGLTRSSWYREIERGTLVQIHPGVARLVGTPDSPEQRIIAGVLAIREPALASHRSAARLWGIPRPDDDPVDVILTARTTRPSARRCRHPPVDRSGASDSAAAIRDSVHQHPAHADRPRRRRPHRGAHGGRARGHPPARFAAGDRGGRRRARRRGRGGIVAVRDAIADWSIDDKPADSILEVVMHRLIDRFDLPPVEFHPVIEGHEVDFRVIASPVILECDGWAYHGLDRANFERDRDRDADLTAAGWIVVRFTYRAITTRPKATADRIRAALDRWTPSTDAVTAPSRRRLTCVPTHIHRSVRNVSQHLGRHSARNRRSGRDGWPARDPHVSVTVVTRTHPAAIGSGFGLLDRQHTVGLVRDDQEERPAGIARSTTGNENPFADRRPDRPSISVPSRRSGRATPAPVTTWRSGDREPARRSARVSPRSGSLVGVPRCDDLLSDEVASSCVRSRHRVRRVPARRRHPRSAPAFAGDDRTGSRRRIVVDPHLDAGEDEHAQRHGRVGCPKVDRIENVAHTQT